MTRHPGLDDPHEALRVREEKHAMLQRVTRLEEDVDALQKILTEHLTNCRSTEGGSAQ